MRRAAAPLLLLSAFLPCAAHAHHGKDFLVVESYEIPHPGDVYALGSAATERTDGERVTELEPALLAGIASRIAGELHGHFVRDPGRESFTYESIAPALHVQLTGEGAPIDVGASAEYEFGAHDAPDALEGRLIFEKGFDGLKLSVNGVVDHVRGMDTQFGYAAGLRLELSEPLAVGVESQGSFDTGANESLAGVYWEPTGRLTLKAGVGGRLASTGPERVARAGVVFRF